LHFIYLASVQMLAFEVHTLLSEKGNSLKTETLEVQRQ